MRFLRFAAIPLIVALCVGGPVCWAWPEELSPWRSAGIVLGWCGCGLLLASLLLMLREARLASALGGLERMYRWHHGCGTLAYLCLLAHPLALAAEAWGESPGLAWATLSPWSEGWPLWTGWLGLIGLMAGLAATFDRRLGYRPWRWLHALLGGAVLFGLGHLVLLGVSAPSLLLIVLVVAFLAWRLLRNDFGGGARPYVVRAVQPVARDMVEIVLAPLAEAGRLDFGAQAGQFALVAFGSAGGYRGCGEFHPFTLSRVVPGGQLAIGVKALGPCTRRIQAMEAGVPARVQGPFGSFLATPPTAPQYWVAGGIGITPFLAVLRAAGCFVQPIRLLYLYRHAEDGAFVAELESLAAAHPGFSLAAVATGDQWPDLAALVPAARDLTGVECWLCGPPGLVGAVGKVLRQRGVTARRLHFESYDFR